MICRGRWTPEKNKIPGDDLGGRWTPEINTITDIDL